MFLYTRYYTEVVYMHLYYFKDDLGYTLKGNLSTLWK